MLRSRARLAIKKKWKCFPFPGHLNSDSSFWFKLKEKKKDKSQFVYKFTGIKITVVFI